MKNRPLHLRLLLAAAAGVLIGFSPHQYPAPLLAVVGFVPFFIAVEGPISYRTGLLLSYVTFFFLHLVVCYWLLFGKHWYLLTSGIIYLLLDPLLLCLPALLFLFILKRRGETASLILFPFVWVAFEYLRTRTEVAVPVFILGNSQTCDAEAIQVASIAGVYGISFWLALLNVGIYRTYANVSRGTWKWRSLKSLGAALVILLLYSVPKNFGEMILHRHPAEVVHGSEGVRIGVVQPNIDPYEKWQGHANRQIAVLESLTVESARRHPDLIVWPETALPLYILLPENRDRFANLRRLIDSLGVPLLTGFTDWRVYPPGVAAPRSSKTDTAGRRFDIFNSAMLLRPHVDSVRIYNKIRLLPFGERVPYADLITFLDLNFIRWNFGTGGYGVGWDTTVFSLDRPGVREVKFSTVICFESIFPGLVRSFVRKGADAIIVITNDTWWGRTTIPLLHNQVAALRAVENRRWVVRCANNGVSSVFDPYGRMIAATNLFERGTLQADIGIEKERTFYSEHGDWLAAACVIAAACGFVVSLPRRLPGKMEKGDPHERD